MKNMFKIFLITKKKKMLVDIDEDALGLSSSNDEKKQESGDGGWDDDDQPATPAFQNDEDDGIVDNWEDAPDYAEIERQKKEKEEAEKKAKEEAAEAERQRKELKKQKAELAKKIKQQLEQQDSDDDEAGLFDVELTREQEQQQDYKMAVDALGLDFGDENIEVKDIMTFKPDTKGDFEALRKELVKVIHEKIDSKSKDYGTKIGYILRALIDDYKSVQMKEINSLLIKLSNEKLHQQRLKQGKKDKKAPTSNKTFFNARDDDGDDDFN